MCLWICICVYRSQDFCHKKSHLVMKHKEESTLQSDDDGVVDTHAKKTQAHKPTSKQTHTRAHTGMHNDTHSAHMVRNKESERRTHKKFVCACVIEILREKQTHTKMQTHASQTFAYTHVFTSTVLCVCVCAYECVCVGFCVAV